MSNDQNFKKTATTQIISRKMKQPSNLLASVIMDLKIREERGLATYGTTMDRKDLSKQEWLQHAYEEALDLALYLKKLMENHDKLKIKEDK